MRVAKSAVASGSSTKVPSSGSSPSALYDVAVPAARNSSSTQPASARSGPPVLTRSMPLPPASGDRTAAGPGGRSIAVVVVVALVTPADSPPLLEQAASATIARAITTARTVVDRAMPDIMADRAAPAPARRPGVSGDPGLGCACRRAEA